MACGCHQKVPHDPARTRAAMCLSCTANRNGIDCAASTAKIELHVRGKPCPRGRHPNALGLVTWIGAQWVGVPWPIRLWRWSENRDDRWFGLPGCGCLARAKAWWSAVASAAKSRLALHP